MQHITNHKFRLHVIPKLILSGEIHQTWKRHQQIPLRWISRAIPEVNHQKHLTHSKTHHNLPFFFLFVVFREMRSNGDVRNGVLKKPLLAPLIWEGGGSEERGRRHLEEEGRWWPRPFGSGRNPNPRELRRASATTNPIFSLVFFFVFFGSSPSLNINEERRKIKKNKRKNSVFNLLIFLNMKHAVEPIESKHVSNLCCSLDQVDFFLGVRINGRQRRTVPSLVQNSNCLLLTYIEDKKYYKKIIGMFQRCRFIFLICQS